MENTVREQECRERHGAVETRVNRLESAVFGVNGSTPGLRAETAETVRSVAVLFEKANAAANSVQEAKVSASLALAAAETNAKELERMRASTDEELRECRVDSLDLAKKVAGVCEALAGINAKFGLVIGLSGLSGIVIGAILTVLLRALFKV